MDKVFWLIVAAVFLPFMGCANKEVIENLQRENAIQKNEISQLQMQNQSLISRPPYFSSQTGEREGRLKNTYTVKKGDTLLGIAKREYGTVKMAKAIFEANKNRIKNMNNLPVGITILLPPK